MANRMELYKAVKKEDMVMKFTKNDIYYWATKNDKVVAIINIHYNFFDRSYFYTVNDKQFNKLNDAKKYVRENF